ncbi:PEP-CTERM sorting domain-containing protein [Luteolibacter sp. GHJ8]|uniref:PEP-CTERM sorting domain-containing protein n=1 Tax=Luteolibacter rhizosphaerae TaxID=2989719 RepID=A0ABT3G990_9BACT|nr:PEP-CTERM sorting domain-containing protein [Luteolibacter rhizosphaerae]MCW1916202.1 PEP-CTERM sorting domain-containing protein [Luteolibacter rhizosphaerae]
MTARQQLVSCGVSCVLALSGSAFAAVALCDESGSTGGNRPLGRLEEATDFTTQSLAAEGAETDLRVTRVDRVPGMLTAVPEPAAILIGSIGLLALVRRRRG